MTDPEKRKSAAELLAAVLDRPSETIPAGASIFNYPAWDSLVHVKLMISLEEVTDGVLDPALIATLVDLKEIDHFLENSTNPDRSVQ